MLWIDVTDVRSHLKASGTVTGIQRASIEIIRALEGRCDFRLVEFDRQILIWREVQIAQIYDVTPSALPRGIHKTLISLIPKPFRRRIIKSEMSRLAKREQASLQKQANFQPDDFFLSIGAFWYFPGQADCIQATVFENQMRLVLLIYDLIPITHPDWFGTQFSVWWAARYELLVRQAVKLLAISQHTARAVATYNKAKGIISESKVIRLGDTHIKTDYEGSPKKLVDEPFVLLVSTIDVRKNQKLLVAVWRRLVRLHGRCVPKLVLVGKESPYSAELHEILQNSPSVRGRIVIINSATDDDLKILYKSCLFTVFPTKAEGWGFPVAESLMFGKACIASRVDSIPEVGRTFCEYVDVDDTDAWYQAIERFMFDGHSLRRCEERIAADYKATPWSMTVDDILSEFCLSKLSCPNDPLTLHDISKVVAT